MHGIGIIGCGAIFKNHIDVVLTNNQVKLVAICDINEDKTHHYSKEFNCTGYTDYKELIQDNEVDVIHICTPHYLHHEMILAALNSNKHVICEKPVVMNSGQVNSVKDALKTSKSKLCIIFQNRYNITSQTIMDYIKINKLGEVKGIKGFVTWHRDAEYYERSGWRGFYKTEGGGVMINQAIHTLDLIQWFGGELEWLKGSIDTRILNDVIEVEDTAEVTMKFINGATGIFYATTGYVQDSPVEIEVMFEEGALRIFQGRLYLIKNGDMVEIKKDQQKKGPKSYWGNSHGVQINGFYDQIIMDGKDFINIHEGSKAVKIIEAIRQSSQQNKKIYFDN